MALIDKFCINLDKDYISLIKVMLNLKNNIYNVLTFKEIIFLLTFKETVYFSYISFAK